MNRRTRRIVTGVAAGAVAGLAASYAMNVFQGAMTKAEQKLKPQENAGKQDGAGSEADDATTKAAKAISKKVFQHELPDKHKKEAGSAVHYGFGTLVGAAYGLMAETVPHSRIGFGTAYGALVWLGADEIAVPALGLSQPSTKTPLSAHAKALASHLVYGSTTELVRRLMVRAIRGW